MRVTEHEKKENLKFLPFLVSIIPPSVFLLYLYQRNAAYLSILHTLIAIAIFTIVAVILQLVISKMVKSSGVAVLINNILWILFFIIKAPYYLFNLYIKRNLAIYLCIMIVITTIIITLIVRYKSKLQKHEIFQILSVFWLVIFLFNAIPTFGHVIGNHLKKIGNESNYKTEFNVDNNLPSPSIYWLFMDGMLGFKAMEYFFNDPQVEFSSQLTERGFIINRNAQFEALHATIFSISVLMCPYYYDNTFLHRLKSINLDDYNYMLKIKAKNIASYYSPNNLGRLRNELITAFNLRENYRTNIIAIDTYSFPPSTNNYYIRGNKINKNNPEAMNEIEKLRFGVTLLNRTTLLGKLNFIFAPLLEIYENSKYSYIPEILNTSDDVYKSFFGESYQGNGKWYLSALIDIMNYKGPKLVIIHDDKPHYPFIYDERGSLLMRKQKEMTDPYNYPSQHYFANSIVISYIDYIINIDPDAIIILQSDHGLHAEETRQLLIFKYGKTDEEVRLIQNQTISAVRIPRKYGGLDEPVEPPNISRLLVNRYVGENYRMLSSEDIIK
jgi:hypothetical protein